MKLQLLKPHTAATTGLLLTAPAAYFIFVSVLKYFFHLPGPFDASEPLLLSLGIDKPLGWNINLLVVLGPLLSIVFNLLSILWFEWKVTDERLFINLSFERKTWNWMALLLSGGCLALLLLYALGENCRC